MLTCQCCFLLDGWWNESHFCLFWASLCRFYLILYLHHFPMFLIINKLFICWHTSVDLLFVTCFSSPCHFSQRHGLKVGRDVTWRLKDYLLTGRALQSEKVRVPKRMDGRKEWIRVCVRVDQVPYDMDTDANVVNAAVFIPFLLWQIFFSAWNGIFISGSWSGHSKHKSKFHSQLLLNCWSATNLQRHGGQIFFDTECICCHQNLFFPIQIFCKNLTFATVYNDFNWFPNAWRSFYFNATYISTDWNAATGMTHMHWNCDSSFHFIFSFHLINCLESEQ